MPMNTYKNDSFGSRLATAANARNAALERFRARPGPDDVAVLERQAARKAVSVARDARIGERKAAREAEAVRLAAEQAACEAALKAAAAEQAARAIEASERAAALAIAQKAARDARYAARNARRR
jgi:hypothetical protein